VGVCPFLFPGLDIYHQGEFSFIRADKFSAVLLTRRGLWFSIAAKP